MRIYTNICFKIQWIFFRTIQVIQVEDTEMYFNRYYKFIPVLAMILQKYLRPVQLNDQFKHSVVYYYVEHSIR